LPTLDDVLKVCIPNKYCTGLICWSLVYLCQWKLESEHTRTIYLQILFTMYRMILKLNAC